MSNTTYNGSIALTKLIHAKYKSKKGTDCIMIPIKDNFLESDDNGNIYLPIRVITKEEADQYGQHGFVAKSIGSKDYKAASDQQKEEWKSKEKEVTPILGSIKNFGASSGANDNSGAISNDVLTDDDLAF